MPKHAQRLLEQSQAIRSQRQHATAPSRVQPVAASAILQRAALAPQSLRPPDIQRLQQTLGNRAVAQMLSQRSPARSLVQAKLTINAPGDRYEQEADRVADEVTQKPAAQRAESEEDEDETPSIMTKPQPSSTAGGAFEADDGFERQLQGARGQGRPLPPALREDFETRFGADFRGVRIHANAQSDRLNRSIGAQAFTTGQDVFFRRGAYQPESHVGQKLVAHELTHVVQQSGVPQSGRTIQRDVGFEFETDWGIHGGNDPKKKSKPRLRKHRAYKKYDGFEVQVDEASRGFKADYPELGFEIEFVVKPHAETKEGGKQLKLTMERLLAVVNEMEGEAKKFPAFMLRERGEKLWVFPKAKIGATHDIKALPQATIGLSLAAIHEYGSIEEKTLNKLNPDRPLFTFVRREITLGGEWGKKYEAIAKKAGEIEGASKTFAGFVTLLAFYICRFQEGVKKPEAYAKAVMPVLAKTNFAFMFNKLNRTDQKKYREDPDSFVDLVLEVVNGVVESSKLKKDQQVIPATRVRYRTSWKVGELTLGAWLKEIPGGKDSLTEQYYEELFGFGNLGGKEGKGGKGDKADRVPGKKSAMVLEFRAGVGGMQIPAKQWEAFAFDYFHLVRRLHGTQDV
jgi:hypothetical protein